MHKSSIKQTLNNVETLTLTTIDRINTISTTHLILATLTTALTAYITLTTPTIPTVIPSTLFCLTMTGIGLLYARALLPLKHYLQTRHKSP